ncbi:hypothetical protein [Mesorhizobium sp. M0306]|uniref:hypothetical protein n=1 Tax=unclassified Mesorhizobium TaxID=325217 RepID=UPI00333A0D88
MIEALSSKMNIPKPRKPIGSIHAGCDTLLSEDMQHAMALDEGLRIVNPFRVAS